MKLFLWVYIVMLTLTCLGKLIFIVRGYGAQRTRKTEAIDLAFNIGFIVWAAVLLAGLY